ncbi:hypothetical protein Ancab_036238 [Ancistrocladus abbreviatus]
MRRRASLSLWRFFLRSPLHQSPVHQCSFLSKPVSAILPQTTLQSCSTLNITLCAEAISEIRYFHQPSSSITSTFFKSLQSLRNYSAKSATEIDVNKIVDEINLKFAEAREEVEAAMESKETVYFDEEAECARAAVKEVLEMFEDLLGKVEERERVALQRSMGLKIEQLKAELQQLND